jgi:hypothetical protein
MILCSGKGFGSHTHLFWRGVGLRRLNGEGVRKLGVLDEDGEGKNSNLNQFHLKSIGLEKLNLSPSHSFLAG